MRDKAHDLVEQAKADWLLRASDGLEFLLAHAESPIEAMLLAQFVLSGCVNPSVREDSLPPALWAVVLDLAGDPEGRSVSLLQTLSMRTYPWASPWSAMAFVVQMPVRIGDAEYRLDFALVEDPRAPGAGRGPCGAVRLGIEVDGHDFHERTKEQAARDKRRDRALTAAGWTMLRYTGSEVYRDPSAVFRDVIEQFGAARERSLR